MIVNKIITLSDGKRIAEFRLDYQQGLYNFFSGEYDWSDLFRLDRDTLLIRIENLKKQNLDYSVEQQALFLLDNPNDNTERELETLMEMVS